MSAMKSGLAVAEAVLALGAVDFAQGGQSPVPASMMTKESVNAFRLFAVEREKDLAFYADALGIPALNALNMPGGGQMSLFHIGTSQFKFTGAGQRAEKSGPVLDVTGLRVFTYFYADEAAVTKAFTSHGYPAPDFQGPAGHRRAMVTDPDGQWCELVIGGDPSHFEIGATVKDLDRSRAFYLGFVGLEELPVTETAFGKTYRFKLGPKSAN